MATESELTKNHVLEMFEKWDFLVINRGYKFRTVFHKNYHAADGKLTSEAASMQVWCTWQHLIATIHVNLEECSEQYSDIEWIVVHELVHMLMGYCEYPDSAMEERACSEIASAILETQRKGTDNDN